MYIFANMKFVKHLSVQKLYKDSNIENVDVHSLIRQLYTKIFMINSATEYKNIQERYQAKFVRLHGSPWPN